MMSKIEEQTVTTLYSNANTIASGYLPSYFTRAISTRDVQTQLKGMQDYLESNVWFVKRDGSLITSSTMKGQNSAPQTISNFNPAENGSNLYQIGSYHDYFDEDVITVIAPVTQGFTTNGYLLIHKPYSLLEQTCQDMMTPVYITVLVIYLLSFIILIAVQFFIYHPLRQITEAAKQYALGNLDYEIPIKT